MQRGKVQIYERPTYRPRRRAGGRVVLIVMLVMLLLVAVDFAVALL
jgi:hypothetical protein